MSNRCCYLCNSTNTEFRLSESPIEKRFGKPVLPADIYSQDQCNECGLLFVDCDVTESYLNELYASETVDWQKEFLGSDESVGNARILEFKKLSQILKSHLNSNKHQTLKILDFGCQTGEFVEIFGRDMQIEPCGVEMSEDYAKHALALWGSGLVHVGNLSDAPFAEESFDIISAQETLEHIVDPIKTLEQLRKVTKMGGLLLVSVPSSDYFILKKRVYNLFNRGPALIHTHLYNFTPKSLSLMLKKSGFEPVETFGIGWHDSAEKIGNSLSGLVRTMSRGARVYSPSVVAIARAI